MFSSSSCGARKRARLLARTGPHEDAEILAREAVAISSLTDALLDRAGTHAALAEALAAAGSTRQAKREAGEAARLLTEKGLNAKESPIGSPFALVTYPPLRYRRRHGACRFRLATSFRAPTVERSPNGSVTTPTGR